MTYRIHQRLGSLASTGFAFLFAWFFYCMVFDGNPPLIIDDNVQVLSPQPVPRNDVLRMRYHLTVERACTGRGSRIFIDAGGIPQPSVPFKTDTSTMANGQASELGVPFDQDADATVPNGAAPGPATYQNQTIYFCNFWQRLFKRGIEVDFPVVNFAIGEKTLPRVVPGRAIFKRTDTPDVAAWLRRKVGWNRSEDP